MKTAHIIPRSIPVKIVLGVIGQRELTENGHDLLWDIKNGLPMWWYIEEALDEGCIVIVPLTRLNDWSADRLKVVVLDKKLFNETNPSEDLVNNMNKKNGTISTFRELHNPQLIFKHPTNCPARRNLFFHFVITIRRRQLYEPPGRHEDGKLIEDIKGMMAIPGSYF